MSNYTRPGRHVFEAILQTSSYELNPTTHLQFKFEAHSHSAVGSALAQALDAATQLIRFSLNQFLRPDPSVIVTHNWQERDGDEMVWDSETVYRYNHPKDAARIMRDGQEN